MKPGFQLLALSALASSSLARPTGELGLGPVPGQTSLYNSYRGEAPPFPGNVTGATLPATTSPPGPDDLLFQNLLAAEWIVFSFYQQGVEAFNSTSFTDLGFPNTTYDRIAEIRDNEAGHLNLFYRFISSSSVKPGPCKYDFGFSSPESWLAEQVVIELSSMAFLTGLVQQAQTNASRAALLAVAEVETRHNTWALIDIWNTNPFAGPVDTVYPYANQILDITNQFVVEGSCPKENPVYPSPVQHLPPLAFNAKTSDGHPGSRIELEFPKSRPEFEDCKEYFMVYFHGVSNITVPFDPKNGTSVVPAEFDVDKGLILGMLSSEPGAPTLESCVAGPLLLTEQPGKLTNLGQD